MGAGMRKYPLFQPDDEYNREFQPLRRVHSHQGDTGVRSVLVRVRDKRSMVDEVAQCLSLPLSLGSSVNQFFDVHQPALGLLGILFLEGLNVSTVDRRGFD